MVAELKHTPIEVIKSLDSFKQDKPEQKIKAVPYREGGHAELISQAQLHGSVRLGTEDLKNRPELIHPLYRDILQSADIQISNFGLAKTINRQTGEVQEIEIVSGKPESQE